MVLAAYHRAEPGKRTIPCPHPERDRHLETAFRRFIAQSRYPCVGAKAALGRGGLVTLVCPKLTSGWDDLRIAHALIDWAHGWRREPRMFRSMAILFHEPRSLDEQGFEQAMWQRIQSLSDKDRWLGQRRDPRVSSDPSDPHFALSFGGEGFFAVGLHPRASRPARRFRVPAIVFNLHDQFERLRADGRYDTMRRTILDRDKAWAGSVNPMLVRHGEGSAARQYSGRVVPEDWVCPYRRP
jgi:FPC/CPF motif-containing protein YcgG